MTIIVKFTQPQILRYIDCVPTLQLWTRQILHERHNIIPVKMRCDMEL